MLLSVIFTGIQKKKLTEKFLRELHKMYIEDVDQYLMKLDGFVGRLMLPLFTREFMKLSHYLKIGNKEKVEELSRRILNMGLKRSEKIAVSQKLFAFFLENGDYESADKIHKFLQETAKDPYNIQLQTLLFDMDLAYDVYVNKNQKRICELTEFAHSVKDNEMRSIYFYRLAILYDAVGDNNRYKSSLQSAINLTNNTASKIKIKQLLKKDEDDK